MTYGLKRKAVNYNGAALGVIIAVTLSLANHAFLACLATFFFSSSRVTKFRSQVKRKIEIDFKGGKMKQISFSMLNANYWHELLNHFPIDA